MQSLLPQLKLNVRLQGWIQSLLLDEKKQSLLQQEKIDRARNEERVIYVRQRLQQGQ